jgi:hypothetical protein
VGREGGKQRWEAKVGSEGGNQRCEVKVVSQGGKYRTFNSAHSVSRKICICTSFTLTQ